MNILESIDQTLLRYTQRIARRIYRICGLTNFALVKWIAVTALILRCFVIFLTVSEIGWTVSNLLIQIVLILFILFMYISVLFAAKKTRPGLANSNRIDFSGMRKTGIFIAFAFIFFCPSHSISLFSDESIKLNEVSAFCESFSVVLVFFVAPYFLSIEPEPPSESKLKKLIGAMKGFFSSSAIPQPT